MRAVIVIAFLLTIVGWGNAQSDAATIYIYRAKNGGAETVNYLIYVDGVEVCKLSYGKYIVLQNQPGEVKLLGIPSGLWKSDRRSEPLVLNVEADKSYYIEADARYNLIRYWMVLKQVNENTYIQETKKHVLDNCQQ